ncbi:ABC transporter permease [Reinekea marinisedimentorum]|uniref:Putative ABC transport system permease protein n=1 Tax=Reinekea marinisedimentorum TaxID=230495 RepID=A0A4R3I515_9GAMM|nr:ABC transporter permease [Reinekea marinisedimentorum]TCS41043.1 putative ABC transport system permease protein [Reinekea marinisedimentorum]
MILFRLTLKSLANRKATVLMTLAMLVMSNVLLLTVDRLRLDTRASFANTVSGTDLIIGARTGSLNLLLYSVFHLGNATNNISWQSYQELIAQKEIDWAIPISLGDSHRGYRVVGTDTTMFTHYRYGKKQNLAFADGEAFDGVFDVVLGAEVAKSLGYKVGDEIVVAHGVGKTSFTEHGDKPFTVTGILKATGTPIDKSLFVSLEAITAIHVDWINGVKLPGVKISAEQALTMDLQPDSITAAMIGLKSRMQIFTFQRLVNNYRAEPLTAIIPGTALAGLWQLIGLAENALIAVSVIVAITALLGMTTVILTSLNERQREMAVLRAIGLSSSKVAALLVMESGFYGVVSVIAGYLLHALSILALAPIVQEQFGINLSLSVPSLALSLTLGGFLLATFLLGLIPGIAAYKRSLADGLIIRR